MSNEQPLRELFVRRARADDGYDYVRSHYGVEVEIGQRVVIDGTPAVIVKGEADQYLHFTPNGGHNFLIAHPTWRVDYNPWICAGCGAGTGRYDDGEACTACVTASFGEMG